jgi:hypothetical protein
MVPLLASPCAVPSAAIESRADVPARWRTPLRRVAASDLGYAFRWLGDGGGLGIAFMVLARTLIARPPRRRAAVALGIAYGLVIWVCLLVTLIASPEGQMLLFPLTAVTLVLSWFGHVVYGAVLGAMFGWPGRRPVRLSVPAA